LPPDELVVDPDELLEPDDEVDDPEEVDDEPDDEVPRDPDDDDAPDELPPDELADSSPGAGSVGLVDDVAPFDGPGEVPVPPYGPPSGGSLTPPHASPVTHKTAAKRMEGRMGWPSRRLSVARALVRVGFMGVSGGVIAIK
jgi:hypothetical protein